MKNKYPEVLDSESLENNYWALKMRVASCKKDPDTLF